MKVYESEAIRNVGLVGHGHCGKTSLAAALLHTAGATPRLTHPDEGNTVTDYDEEEIQRHMTISTAVAVAEHKRCKINLLDTPGFNAFLHDTHAALQAADSALVVVDGVSGVEVQTRTVCGYCDELQLPRAFVVNKLDRENADFDRVLTSIRNSCGRAVVPVQIPIGAEKGFRGVIDLVRMKAHFYEQDGNGRGKEERIPAALEPDAKAAHEALIEMVAEGNDELMEEFFASGTLSPDRLTAGLKQAVAERRLFPVFCTCAEHNVGVDLILDFIADNLPAPTQHVPVQAHAGENIVERPITDGLPPALFVFKTVADPFAGRVSYFKVYSGVVKNDAHLINERSHNDERLAHIGSPMGKQILPVPELHAGDIGAVAKLRDTLTGDTLCDKAQEVVYDGISAPAPSIAYAISAKTRQDEDRMGAAIQRIIEEDPTLKFYRDPATNEFLLAGCGQQHVEVVVSKLRRRYNVDVTLSAPKVPYRETIRGKAEVQGRHKKQTGGHGQFGDCWIRFEPLGRGEGFQFASAIFGGSIPRQYVPAVEKGLLEASQHGPLAGYPLVDFKATVYDGSYHDVDSSELAFKQAARKAYRAAMELCKPVLLEPVMMVEIVAPSEYAGDLMSDLNSRRGRIQGFDMDGGTQTIRAHVPMAEMLDYGNDLTSLTQGRASFTMTLDHYDSVPQAQADKIIAAAQANRKGKVEEED